MTPWKGHLCPRDSRVEVLTPRCDVPEVRPSAGESVMKLEPQVGAVPSRGRPRGLPAPPPCVDAAGRQRLYPGLNPCLGLDFGLLDREKETSEPPSEMRRAGGLHHDRWLMKLETWRSRVTERKVRRSRLRAGGAGRGRRPLGARPPSPSRCFLTQCTSLLRRPSSVSLVPMKLPNQR